jgi:glyoxylase-like metal-dependent hydrolase (beta-lactamase superfamily II)
MSSRFLLPIGFSALFVAGVLGKALLAASVPTPVFGEPEPGTFPPRWISGLDCPTDPKIQVHAYNDDLWILRQSKCTNFEAPFVYLIFGVEKVLMIDTGSSGSPGYGAAVDSVVSSWEQKNGITGIELIVSHSHPHSDHIQGDPEFVGRPNTTIVGHSLSAVQTFFGFDPGQYPDQLITYDLGGRTLDVMMTPGHHPASLTFYDRRTQLLLTGDIVYPGHLFVFSPAAWTDFKDSIERMLHFSATHPVEWVLGCHIELSSQGVCYPWGTGVHPDEHVLQLQPQVLKEIHDAAEAMGDSPVCGIVHPDFVIHPVYLCPINEGC